MKAKLILLCVLLQLMGTASCTKKKDATTSPNNPTYTYDMVATINGVPYSQSNYTFREEQSFLYISNSDSSGARTFPNISFQVINSFDTGTYDLAGAGAYAFLNTSATTTITDAYGTLHVATRTASMITGTFSFTSLDSTKVTNGSFTAKHN